MACCRAPATARDEPLAVNRVNAGTRTPSRPVSSTKPVHSSESISDEEDDDCELVVAVAVAVEDEAAAEAEAVCEETRGNSELCFPAGTSARPSGRVTEESLRSSEPDGCVRCCCSIALTTLGTQK